MSNENRQNIIQHPAKGIARILRAISYSFSGMTNAFKDEAAFRQICALFIICVVCAFYFAGTWSELILLILPAWICIIVELLNTAIENIVDLVTDKWHPLAKKAKDMGSAAQFASQLLLIIVWISYFAAR